MKRCKLLVFLFFLCSGLFFPKEANALIEIVDSVFGIVSNQSSKTLQFTETSTIPGTPGTTFGWALNVRVGGKRILLREEFELPYAPPTWGQNEARGVFYVTPDRKTAITERYIDQVTSSIFQVWNFVKGDPIGSHVIRIYFDGILVREYKFDIIEQEGSPPTYLRKIHDITH